MKVSVRITMKNNCIFNNSINDCFQDEAVHRCHWIWGSESEKSTQNKSFVTTGWINANLRRRRQVNCMKNVLLSFGLCIQKRTIVILFWPCNLSQSFDLKVGLRFHHVWYYGYFLVWFSVALNATLSIYENQSIALSFPATNTMLIYEHVLL